MIQELIDMLDEAIQDLDEAGFPDDAESLYEIAYDAEWPSEQEMVAEIGKGILRLLARRDDEIPQAVTRQLARCLELVRRVRPDVSLE